MQLDIRSVRFQTLSGGDASSSLVKAKISPAAATGRLEVGAGDGDRTHDIQLGKLAFYH
jgi:hypothetical protein